MPYLTRPSIRDPLEERLHLVHSKVVLPIRYNQISPLLGPRYTYGFEIDFEPSELYESYLAADKYLLHGFSQKFSRYIKKQLKVKNSCLIYDQLIKIGDPVQTSLDEVKSMIVKNRKEAFESEQFTEIDQETLISLLLLDELTIAEFDLFAAVSKWIDCEVRRQDLPMNGETRRRVFELINSYIVFTALKPDQITNCEWIAQLLTDEERGSLLLHWLNKDSPLKIELKTSRKAAASAYNVRLDESGLVEYSRMVDLSVKWKVLVSFIHTTYSGSATNLSLEIRNSDGVNLGLKPESSFRDGKWSFSFEPPFTVKPDCKYTLRITGDEQLKKEDLLSKERELKGPGHSFLRDSFHLSPHCVPDYSGRHFIAKISSHFPETEEEELEED